ncbi:Leukotoxin [Andreprevotia sp. IGB-42]|nr:Leukotoxin [Andreprevotia sp. IGB-42]
MLNTNTGSYVYTPASNYNGADSFTVRVSDGKGGTVDSVVSINVTPVNDAPTTADQSKTTPEDTAVTGQIVAADVDGDTLSYAVQSGVAHGSLVLNTVTGAYTYTPVSNYNGADSFTIRVSDGKGGTVDSVVTINVTPVNDAPVTADQNKTTPEDTAVTGQIVASDVDGDTLSYAIKTTAAHGTLTLNSSTGAYTYTPASNYNGADSFTVRVSDGKGGTVDSVVTLNVTPVNDAPDAVNDPATSTGLRSEYYAYSEGTSGDGANITSLAMVNAFIASHSPSALFTAKSVNYSLADGDLGGNGNLQTFLGTDAASLNADPDNSSDAIINMTGNITLAAGSYNFKVRADDGYAIYVDGVKVAEVDKNQSPTGTEHASFTVATSGVHTIQILYWDQGGQAVFQPELRLGSGSYQSLSAYTLTSQVPFSTTEDTALTISKATLLLNDTDADGDTLSITAVQDALHGTVALVGGNVVFTPDANYSGPASFTYTITDGHGGTDTATVSLVVTAVNDAPVAVNDSLSTAEDVVLTVNTSTLLANDTDVDGNTLTVTGVSAATNGTVSLSNGVVTFTPTANFNGQASFTYTVSDNHGGTTTATANITVTPVNDAPVTANQSKTTAEDTSVTGQIVASDVDGDALVYTIKTGPLNGSVTLNGNGSYIYAPNADYNGADSFTIRVSDGKGGTADSVVSVTVTPVNDAPTTNNATAAGTEDQAGRIAVVLTGADIDGTVASFRLSNLPANGTLYTTAAGNTQVAINSDLAATGNSLTVYFKPNADWNGSTTFSFAAKDNSGAVDATPATATISVAAVNDAAVIAGTTTGTVQEDTKLSTTGTLTITDVDGAAERAFTPQSSNGTYGQFSINAAGSWTYTLNNAAANVQALNTSDHKTETFTVTSVDGTQKTVTIDVQGLTDNTAPVADSHNVTAKEGVPFALGITAPTDADGDALTITVTGLPTQGQVLLADGTAISNGQTLTAAQLTGAQYLLPPGISSTTSVGQFTYSVSDGTASSSGNIGITVTNNNNAYEGFGGNDTFQLTKGNGNNATLNISLTTYMLPGGGWADVGAGPGAGVTKQVAVTLDTDLVVASGGSNDTVDLGVSHANNVVFTDTSLPNSNGPQPSVATLYASKFMTDAVITDADGALLTSTQAPVQPITDTINVGSGNDTVYGAAGNQAVFGGAGNDKLYGGADTDALRGGAGDDLLVGGKGSDVLRGDLGNDTFKFVLGDQSSTAGSVAAGNSNGLGLSATTKLVAGATDVIMDFHAVNGDKDVLDLRDLLQGEGSGTLDKYLHFQKDGSDTVIHISHDGQFVAGLNVNATTYAFGKETETIVLKGTDLIGTDTTDAQVIQHLLQSGKLITD